MPAPVAPWQAWQLAAYTDAPVVAKSNPATLVVPGAARGRGADGADIARRRFGRRERGICGVRRRLRERNGCRKVFQAVPCGPKDDDRAKHPRPYGYGARRFGADRIERLVGAKSVDVEIERSAHARAGAQTRDRYTGTVRDHEGHVAHALAADRVDRKDVQHVVAVAQLRRVDLHARGSFVDADRLGVLVDVDRDRDGNMEPSA
jgi:hypothetical protein